MKIKGVHACKVIAFTLAAMFMVQNLVTLAYATNSESYKLRYGDKVNIVSTNDIDIDENVDLLQFTQHYNAKALEGKLGNKEYKGKHFKFSIDAESLNKKPYYNEAYKDEPDVEQNLEITGLIGIPDKPVSDELYIFMHGRLGKIENSEYGFSYLVDYLASNGYYAISIDDYEMYYSKIDEEKMFRCALLSLMEHIDSGELEELNTGANIKLNKIGGVHLLGHSRAGYFTFKVADELVKNKYDVKSIISLAPLFLRDFTTEELHPIPVTIILPEFDGDIHTLEGEDIYNFLISNDYKADIETYYIFEANHNFFNTAMRSDDSIGVTIARDTMYELIPREQHMETIISLIAKKIGQGGEKETEIETESETEVEIRVEAEKEHDNDIIYREVKDTYKSIIGNNVDTEIESDIDNYVIESGAGFVVDNDASAFRSPGRYGYIYELCYHMEQFSNICFDIENCIVDEIVAELALDSTTFDMSINMGTDIQFGVVTTDGEVILADYDLTYVLGYCTKVGVNSKRYSTYTPFEQIKLELPDDITVDKIVLITGISTFDIVIKDIYIDAVDV